jgi:glutamine synthetase
MIGELQLICRLDKTALVLCDVVQDDHELAPHAPRSILRNQIKAAQAVGASTAMAASELEYFLYKDTYEESKVLFSIFVMISMIIPCMFIYIFYCLFIFLE